MTTETADHPVPAEPARSDLYLSGLNDPQREAVECLEGPLLVLAGAGTGKTRVLTTRIAHILKTQRAWPSQILAVTFTNKAAQEMKDRVSRLIGRPVDGLWIGTFHSVAARILRRHAEAAGLTRDFTILDQGDQLRIVKQILKNKDFRDEDCPPRDVLARIQRFKDRGLRPDQVGGAEAADFAQGRLLEFYDEYQQRLHALNAADFGDLLLHCLTIFTAESDVLARYQEQFRYVLVDEYQDTNVAQYLWLRLLALGRENICCVGDEDQAIYSWRGAEVGNILRFDKDFSDARVVRLEENYRSTGAILTAASQLVARNRGRLGKTLWTGQQGGAPVEVHGFNDTQDEARFVVDMIEELQWEGGSLDEMAILVRASFQMRELEERLMSKGVPYRIIGGLRFYESREIKDAIAYFRSVVHPDDSLAFERIVNVPRRGLGPATLQMLYRFASAGSVSLGEAARQLCLTDDLRPKARATLRLLLEDLQNWRDTLDIENPAFLAQTILQQSGYIDMWAQSREPDAPGRLENLDELLIAVSEFESLEAFLEHISLVLDRDEGAQGEAVRMMTLHAAKGLEFDNVFLPGWEEKLFPHARALDEATDQALEEERRLAYVGLTRARARVWVSHTIWRMIHGSTVSNSRSRFIDELDGEHVEMFNHFVGYQHGKRRGGDGGDLGFGQVRGPGYRRLQSAQDSSGHAASGKAGSSAQRISVGLRIFHQKYGYGAVACMDGEKLIVEFEKAGSKTVMKRFVTPA